MKRFLLYIATYFVCLSMFTQTITIKPENRHFLSELKVLSQDWSEKYGKLTPQDSSFQELLTAVIAMHEGNPEYKRDLYLNSKNYFPVNVNDSSVFLGVHCQNLQKIADYYQTKYPNLGFPSDALLYAYGDMFYSDLMLTSVNLVLKSNVSADMLEYIKQHTDERNGAIAKCHLYIADVIYKRNIPNASFTVYNDGNAISIGDNLYEECKRVNLYQDKDRYSPATVERFQKKKNIMDFGKKCYDALGYKDYCNKFAQDSLISFGLKYNLTDGTVLKRGKKEIYSLIELVGVSKMQPILLALEESDIRNIDNDNCKRSPVIEEVVDKLNTILEQESSIYAASSKYVISRFASWIEMLAEKEGLK